MKNLASVDLESGKQAGVPRALLASYKHTLHFTVICVILAVISTLTGTHTSAGDPATTPNQLHIFYVFMIGMEWLWVRFIYKGMQSTSDLSSSFSVVIN